MTPRASRLLLSVFRQAWPWTRDASVFVLAVIGCTGWIMFFYGLTRLVRG